MLHPELGLVPIGFIGGETRLGVNSRLMEVAAEAICANGPFLLVDGFESGDTSAWSGSLP